MAHWEEVKDVEGPYWDYPARFDYLRGKREQAACVCAQAVLDGEASEPWVVSWANIYADMQDKIERAFIRWDETHLVASSWVGWHP